MNRKLNLKAVIFDMDGLMFDSERIAQGTWQQAAGEHGFDFPAEIYLGIVGLSYPDVEHYTRGVFGADFPLESIYARKQVLMDKTITTSGLPIKPGLWEILKAVEETNLLRALASSSARKIILRNLHVAGIDAGWFNVILSGDEIRNSKPAPDIFLLAAQQLRVSPEKCLVLEDSNAGIQAACAAGMKSIMIPDMLPATPHTQQCAYRILPDLHAVRELIFLENGS
jgi:HAD superfamily hydrolase (TIGR01509 family)